MGRARGSNDKTKTVDARMGCAGPVPTVGEAVAEAEAMTEAVVAGRDGWGDFYDACRALD